MFESEARLPPTPTLLPPLTLPLLLLLLESLDVERVIDFRLSFDDIRYIAGANGETRSSMLFGSQIPWTVGLKGGDPMRKSFAPPRMRRRI
jgi:hypothetical protein